jgi:hypothetical protein
MKKNNLSKTRLLKDFGKNLPEDVIITDSPKKEKMSKVLLEFAKPLTDECEDDEAFYTAIQISALTWNLSFFPLKERNKLIDEFINKCMKDNVKGNREIKTTKEILLKMLERKEKNFPNIKRMIIDFQISYPKGEPYLNVLSSPTNE